MSSQSPSVFQLPDPLTLPPVAQGQAQWRPLLQAAARWISLDLWQIGVLILEAWQAEEYTQRSFQPVERAQQSDAGVWQEHDLYLSLVDTVVHAQQALSCWDQVTAILADLIHTTPPTDGWHVEETPPLVHFHVLGQQEVARWKTVAHQGQAAFFHVVSQNPDGHLFHIEACGRWT